ncbi:hypothetical protein LXL04_034503 [Taraxacum kok-saghyz]
MEYEEHEKRAWSLDFSRTEPTMLVSGSDDCKRQVFLTSRKTNICSVKYNPGSSFHVAVSSPQTWTKSEKYYTTGTANVTDSNSKTIGVTCVCGVLQVGSADHHIHYYDLQNINQPLHVFSRHRKAFSYVKFLSSYELASASTDSTLRLWDVKQNLQVSQSIVMKNELPPRSFMWCKGREDKEGEIKEDNVKLIADKLMESEQQIKDGKVILEPGTDAMSLVFGQEKGRFLNGVGTGVTATRYFHIPRNKGTTKQEIKDLKCAVQTKDIELEKKNAEVKSLSTKVDEQEETLKLVLAHLAATGVNLQNIRNTSGTSIENVVESHGTADISISKEPTDEPLTPAIRNTIKKTVQNKSVDAIHDTPSPSITPALSKTTKKVFAPKTATTIPDVPAILTKNPLNQRNIVARGEIHLSSQRQLIHGVSLQDDCYKVSILEMVQNVKPSKVMKTLEGNEAAVKQVVKSAVKQVVKSTVKPVNVPAEGNEAVVKPVLKTAVKLVNVPVVQPSEGNEAVVKPVLKIVVKSVNKGDVKRKITYIANGTLAKRTRNSTLNKLKDLENENKPAAYSRRSFLPLALFAAAFVHSAEFVSVIVCPKDQKGGDENGGGEADKVAAVYRKGINKI